MVCFSAKEISGACDGRVYFSRYLVEVTFASA